jgi:uncharacterized protein
MTAYYTLFTGKDNQYYINLKAGNHEIILQSEGYQSKQGALNGIKSIQENSCIINRFESRISQKNEPYFILKAGNGEIIGVSEMYSSKQAMEKGLHSVFENGQTLKVKNADEESKFFYCEIITNGRLKDWHDSKISFIQLIELAFNKFEDAPNKCYTVTYSNGCLDKVKGSMTKGEEVNVKPKMIFNVTATDKS